MSRLFRRPSSKAPRRLEDDPNSVFSSLLNPVTTIHTATHNEEERPAHRRTKSSPGILSSQDQPASQSRPWLSLLVSGRHTSWAGDRPPTRKLIKEPGTGSARPSFSHELSDQEDEARKDDGQKGPGMMRKGVERIRELYRRDKG